MKAQVKKLPTIFTYKDHQAFGVKNGKLLLELLKKAEKLTDYEKALLRKYV